MAAFYFDEDVPEDLVPLLTEREHIVATTRSEVGKARLIRANCFVRPGEVGYWSRSIAATIVYCTMLG